jgi:hypothetical protein
MSFEYKALIKLLANRLVHKHELKPSWRWFEGYMTYGNSILPEAIPVPIWLLEKWYIEIKDII